MMTTLVTKFTTIVFTLVVVCVASATAYAQATIVIHNNDAANVGFNDPTPVAPVGGNSGTTVGQQRLIAFQFAASIWGQTLNSGPTITVSATWPDTLQCTSTTGVLASAGAAFVARDFPGSVPGAWYGTALANALRGSDQNSNPEITARFNVKIGSSGCFDGRQWYYGLDTNHGIGFNFVTVVLHELSHGLGFQTFTNRTTGIQLGDDQSGRFPTIYDRFLLDTTTGKTWPQMTNEERVASAINTGGLVWNGPRVISDAAQALSIGKDTSGRPFMFTPNPLEGGSSVSHWDRSAAPNQLMEPNINNDLPHTVTPPRDLTFSLMVDIGWCSNCAAPTPTPTPSPPPNDNFALAQPISGCSGSVNGTNVGATREPGEPSHDPAGDPGAASVWYQWQAPATRSVTITTAGSNFDTMLGVYTGTTVSNLTVIDKNDDVELGQIRTSTVTFSAIEGTVYMIAVDGWGGETGNIVLNWNVSNCADPLGTLQLSANVYNVNEGAGSLTVTVNRTGDTTGTSTVDYRTIDNQAEVRCDEVSSIAFARCDYATAVGTLGFAGGETSKTFTIPIVDDSFAENNETFNVELSNPSGATLGTSTATVTIIDNDGVNGTNPILTTPFFVRLHYLDFLSREPETGEPWSGVLNNCSDVNNNANCDRLTVSASFFGSPEFQLKGYFVYRFYKLAFNRLPTYQEISFDMAAVTGQTAAEVFARKAAFTNAFTQRPEFTNAYNGLNNTQYVEALMGRYNLTQITTPDPANPDGNLKVTLTTLQLITQLGSTLTRAQVLRAIADSDQVFSLEFNRAFVAMQYFGYLRRAPEQAGFDAWLNYLNDNPTDFRTMVNGFMNSIEYRLRFGPQ